MNGRKRVQMGADGCDGVQGAHRDTKTRQAEPKHVFSGDFVALWSGKFPRT